VESLASNGPPLGFVAGVGYDSTRAKLQPGDVLLLYTDGITEATDSELDMFGEERLVRLLCEHATAGAAAILAAAKRELRTFTGRERYDDDVSILVACVK
jgi:serine phosphatase RsbU (regulator of sigma subunit)